MAEKGETSPSSPPSSSTNKRWKSLHENDGLSRYGGGSSDGGSPRDLVGYGQHPPRVQWPGGAKVALNFVINYEEGAEMCLLHGDSESEKLLSEIVGAAAYSE